MRFFDGASFRFASFGDAPLRFAFLRACLSESLLRGDAFQIQLSESALVRCAFLRSHISDRLCEGGPLRFAFLRARPRFGFLSMHFRSHFRNHCFCTLEFLSLHFAPERPSIVIYTFIYDCGLQAPSTPSLSPPRYGMSPRLHAPLPHPQVWHGSQVPRPPLAPPSMA